MVNPILLHAVSTVRVGGFLLAKTGTAIAGTNVVLVVLDEVVTVGTGVISSSGSGSLGALDVGGGADVVDVVDVVDVASAWTGTVVVVEVVVVVVASGAVSTGTL